MSQEWKLVPVELTHKMCIAYAEAAIAPITPISRSGYAAMLAAAPVPPAGGEVEVWAVNDVGNFSPKMRPINKLPDPGSRQGYVAIETHRAHVTRLQAEVEKVRNSVQAEWRKSDEKWIRERDALKAEVERMKRSAHGFIDEIRTRDIELTKARELLQLASGQLEVCAFALREIATSKGVTSVNLRQMAKSALNSAGSIANQSAPAAKGGE